MTRASVNVIPGRVLVLKVTAIIPNWSPTEECVRLSVKCEGGQKVYLKGATSFSDSFIVDLLSRTLVNFSRNAVLSI